MAMSQDYPHLEIVVVDQTSSQFEGLKHLSGLGSAATVSYYSLPTPNLPAARNFGIEHSDSEFVIFIDDDVEIPVHFVRSIIDTYVGNDIGGVCGVSVPPDCLDYAAEIIRWANLLEIDETVRMDPMTAVKTMIGVNMSFRRSVFKQAGLFDEAFGGSGWGEDTEFTLRVRKLGYKLVLNPKIRIVHQQLVTGGCATRDSAVSDRVRAERLLLRLYMTLKHLKAGPLHAMGGVYRLYRQHALNRKQIRSGIGATVKRHREMIVAVRAVTGYLAGKRTSLL
jgi:GT2 family glycosyltransferase